jgi:hypothetical protein
MALKTEQPQNPFDKLLEGVDIVINAVGPSKRDI